MGKDEGAKKRRIGFLITLAVNVLIVGYIAFSEFRPGAQPVDEVPVSDIKLVFMLLGVCCFGLAVLMDYLKYRRMLMLTEGRFDRKGALECALLGKYYDNVTPFGAGGQPFQIHYLKKRGYSTGTAAAAPAMGFFTQQTAFVLIGAVVFIANRTALRSIPFLNITAYVGLLMYALLPLAIVLMAAFPRPFNAAVRGGVKLLGKLHIVKDVDAACKKSLSALEEYVQCLRHFVRHPVVFAKLMLASLVYQTAILSIPFFMLRAFGGSGDWWTVFSLVVYIYAAITIVPTPGNAGAAEGSFYAVFASLEGGMLFWAMIAWRLLVYYSWLVCGLIVIARGASRSRPRYAEPPAEGPLNTVLFSDLFYPAVDGVVRTTDAYARHLSALGDNVCVVCPRQEGEPAERPYPVYRLPSFRFPGIDFSIPIGVMTKELKREFALRRPDVLHVHSPFFAGRLALRLGRKFRVPVIATFHSKYYDDAMNVTHSKLLSRLMLYYVRDFYTKADIVWACSRSTAETLRTYGYNGEIFVMENGVELSDMPARGELPELAQRAAEELGVDRSKRNLLFVGQLIWQKNFKLILDSLKLLPADEGWRLTVAGCGYNGDEIKAYARKAGLENRVRFLGRIADRRLLCGLYAACGVLFFPSLYDNAPLVLREAAAAGLPALLSAGSNSAEVVTDGFNGFTAEPNAEAMAQRLRAAFSEGTESIRRIGKNAMDTIPVDWAEIVKRAETAYRTCSAEGHVDSLKPLFYREDAEEEKSEY